MIEKEDVVLLDEKEAAQFFSATPSGLRKWRYTGTGPKFYRCNKLIRYRLSDLEAWLENTCVVNPTANS